MTTPLPPLVAWFGGADFPDGTSSVPELSQLDWEAMYARLGAADARGGAVPRYINPQSAVGVFRPDETIPIAVADFPLVIPDPALARAEADKAFKGGYTADLTKLSQGAMPARAFGASALLMEQFGREPVYRGLTVSYRLDARTWFKLADAPLPDAVDIDPGDGGGARRVPFGGVVTARYASGGDGVAHLRLTAHFGDEVRTARFSMAIGGPPAAPQPDDVWVLDGLADDKIGPAKGHAYVHRAPGHAEVVNPIIVAEGFPGGHAPDYLYEILNQQSLTESLQELGYDLVIVGLDNGLVEMQQTAAVVVACIEEAKRRTDKPLVVGGMSMGGIVSRYALTWMEAHSRDHRTRLYLSLDAPHGGAYTSLADQWFAHFLGRASPQAAVQVFAIDSPANKQFMSFWVTPDGVDASPDRKQFLADLAALGDWPAVPRKLGVSCGHGRGATAAGGPTGDGRRLALKWTGAPFAEASLYTLGDDGSTAVVAEGRCALPADNWPTRFEYKSTVAWEDVPGSTSFFMIGADRIAEAVAAGPVTLKVPVIGSISTVSALAIDQDPRSPVGSHTGPFDAVICSDDNNPHLILTRSVVERTIREITTRPVDDAPKAPPPPFDPDAFDPHAVGYLKNPYPTYANFRAHAPVHRVRLIADDDVRKAHPEAQLFDRLWIFRHADIVETLRHTTAFIKQSMPAPPSIFDAIDALPHGLFSMNPPAHDTLRNALEPVLRAEFKNGPAICAQVADTVIGSIKARGTARFELVTDYALPVPAITLFSIFGLPQAHWEGLIGLIGRIETAHDIAQSDTIHQVGAVSVMALHSYLQGMVRAAAPASTLGRLVAAAQEAGFTDDDVQSCCMDFLIAGYLSATFLISTGVKNLLENPQQLSKVQTGKVSIDDAVREMLRFDSPAQLVDRFAPAEVKLASGAVIPAGSQVSMVLGSANHDEAVFAKPDVFDVERKDGGSAIPFGDGVHKCIGLPLVYLTAPVAIQKFLSAFPTARVDGLVQWDTEPYMRAPTSIPLAVD